MFLTLVLLKRKISPTGKMFYLLDTRVFDLFGLAPLAPTARIWRSNLISFSNFGIKLDNMDGPLAKKLSWAFLNIRYLRVFQADNLGVKAVKYQ